MSLYIRSYTGLDAQQGASGISPYGLGSSTIYTPGPLSTLHTASSFTYSEPSEPASAYPPLSALSPTVSAYPSRRQSASLFGLPLLENPFGPQGNGVLVQPQGSSRLICEPLQEAQLMLLRIYKMFLPCLVPINISSQWRKAPVRLSSRFRHTV